MIDFFADDVPENTAPAEDLIVKSLVERVNDAAKSSPLLQSEEIVVDPDDVDSDAEVIAAKFAAESARVLLDQANAAMSDTKAKVATLDEQKAELAKQIHALNQALYAIDRQKDDITYNNQDKRAAINRATREQERAEREVLVVKQNVFTKRKSEITVEGYGRIAAKFSWRTGITLPSGDKVSALAHQWEGIKFLANAGRAILGDQMGLGKTLESIAALDLVGSKRAIVICPNEITSNFVREIKRWAPHRHVISIAGYTKVNRRMALNMAQHFTPLIVVVNYEAWRKDLSLLDQLVDMQFDTLIADEAHNVKGTNTDAFAGVKKITLANNVCPYCGGILELGAYESRRCAKDNYQAGNSVGNEHLTATERAMMSRSVKNVWLMTGTPILNAPEDLYPMLYLLDPIAFPYKSYYLRDYCEQNYATGKYSFRDGGLDSLVLRLSGKYLARTAESAGVVWPSQDIIFHDIEFNDEEYLLQQDIIKQLTEYAAIVLAEDNKMNAIGVLALITRQRQANVWAAGIKIWEHPKDQFGLPIYDQPKVLIFDASEIKESIKLDKVVELVMEHGLVEGNRMAVFSQFKTALAELETRLKALGLRVVRFDGDTSDKLKGEIKTNFDKSEGETPKWDIVLANYKTGGQGLNLTAATHTVILDEEWNPGKRDQSYARTRRQGQDEKTIIHVIRLSNTIDAWLTDLIDDKAKLIAGFEGATVDIQTALLQAIKDSKKKGK